MSRPIRYTRGWDQVGRDDAKIGVYRPPQHPSSVRASYQLGWEEVADEVAWNARLNDEAANRS